ncbi:MAG: hypothetical protein MZV63_64655 [Marinilabiliales bacterium]|nr:hypothetical protein [Marinilabiliales bacterium]
MSWTKHNSLMERIVREHGPLITGRRATRLMGNLPCADDIISEVHFAVFTDPAQARRRLDAAAVVRLGRSSRTRSTISSWQKYWDSDDVDAFKKRQTEQTRQREEVHGQRPHPDPELSSRSSGCWVSD